MEEEGEFEDLIKDYLLKRTDDLNFESISKIIENTDLLIPEERIDLSKENKVIEKLREKSGMPGIGLAGK